MKIELTEEEIKILKIELIFSIKRQLEAVKNSANTDFNQFEKEKLQKLDNIRTILANAK